MIKNYTRLEHKKLVSILVVIILLIVVVAKAEYALANVFSTDQDIVVLQTNSDEKTNLAQMTLLSQLGQSKISAVVKTSTNLLILENELKQSKRSTILVLIGHGTESGLSVGNKEISWMNLKSLLASSKYQWKLLLACFSDEISDVKLKIAGFRDEIDAEGGALVYSFLIKKILQNIHDEDLLDLAVQKSKAKANPLATRKIFFVHGFSGKLKDGSYEWNNLKSKLSDIYPSGTYEYIDYSYCARGFDNSHSGIDDISNDLKNYILSQTQSGDIIDVVGHSMGGIVIRDMVRQYRGNLNSAGVTIEKGIIIAGANDGTPWADVLHYYVTLGWAIYLILMLIFGFIWGTILFVAVDFIVQLIADGYNTPRFRFARVENSWFDNVLNDPSTHGQYSGTIWYGLRVYASTSDPIIIATGMLCSFYGQSSNNDNILSVSSTKLPNLMANYIGTEEEHHYYYHGEAHTHLSLVGKPASWLEPTNDELLSTSGTLSGSGATYTFSKSSLLGTYTVVMVGNEEADFDLYAKWNSPPTTSSYDARSYSGYSSEYFTVTGSGTLYIMVRSFSGSGHWKANILTGTPSESSGRRSGTLSGSGKTATYSLAGSGRAWVYLAGPDSGDFDLYIKWNSPPTTSSYDARGYSSWSQEICNFIGTGTLYYMVRSYSGSGQYSMVAMIF